MYESGNLASLLTMLEAIEKLYIYSDGFETNEELYQGNDQLNYNACVTLLMVIGEECRKLSENIKADFPDIPWRNITAMRNRIAHDYRGLDPIVPFTVIKTNLDPLKEVLIEVVQRTDYPKEKLRKILDHQVLSTHPLLNSIDMTSSQDAYIITGLRSAVGKAGRGGFKNFRSDDLLAVRVIKALFERNPDIDPATVDDVLVGCANPEGEQGLQVGRQISLRALGKSVPGCDRESLLRQRPGDHLHGRSQNQSRDGPLLRSRWGRKYEPHPHERATSSPPVTRWPATRRTTSSAWASRPRP